MLYKTTSFVYSLSANSPASEFSAKSLHIKSDFKRIYEMLSFIKNYLREMQYPLLRKGSQGDLGLQSWLAGVIRHIVN